MFQELHSSFMYAFAGTSVFLLGMSIASESLQKLAANRIRDFLGKLSDKPYMGVLVGMALTFVIQSSGAVTSMLVGLGSAGVISLRQVMSVLLGTAVGTTLTVQLLSLNVAQFGLPVFSVAFVFYFLSRKRTLKHVMSVLMGFGLIFWGLELIGVGTQALRTSNIFMEFLGYLKLYPLATIALTAAFTAVVHSSAVTIGFAMTLAGSGMISLTDAMYWVYGANIGTTATALLASIGGNYVGRQVAWAHCFYKLLSVLVFFIFTEQFVQLIHFETAQRNVANAHTIFNLLAALVFYPFIGKGADLIEKLFAPSGSEKKFSVKFLDRSNFHSTSVAVAHAERELLRMGDIVASMVRDSFKLLIDENIDLEESIQERDNRVDLLNKEINMFLAQFIDESSDLPREVFRIMNFATDLESVGDVIDNTLLDLARKKHSLKLQFSESGVKNLAEIYELVYEATTLSLSCFQLKSQDLASKVIYLKREVRKRERSFRESHLERLIKGNPDSIKTSSIHLDSLSEYRHIAGLMSNHVYSLLKEEDQYNIMPRRDN